MANYAVNTIKSDPNIWYVIAGPLIICAIIFSSIIALSKMRSRSIQLKEIEAEDIQVAEIKLEKGPVDSVERIDENISEQDQNADKEPNSPLEVAEVKALDDEGWLKKLKGGLEKTRSSLTTNIASLVTGKSKLDDEMLEQIHEVLFRADVGVETADTLVNHLKAEITKDKAADWNEVRQCLEGKVSSILSEAQNTLNLPEQGPWVILVVGVNGVGKTTSIGKLAAHFMAQDKSVLLCAADTFRAAAIDQLKVWGDRLGVDVIAHKEGSDPAAVAYDGVKAAVARKHDVLIIDTAGRLHSKKELMDELAKIKKVISKDLVGAPHETWLVIDATMGQNAVQQTRAFNDIVDLSGLVVTKLDGTAKGGVLIGVSDQFKLPIRYLGVGEKVSDLRSFKPEDYSHSLFN